MQRQQQQLEAADRSLPKSGQGGGGSGHERDGRDAHHEHQGLEGGIVEYLGRGQGLGIDWEGNGSV